MFLGLPAGLYVAPSRRLSADLSISRNPCFIEAKHLGTFSSLGYETARPKQIRRARIGARQRAAREAQSTLKDIANQART